jgi:peptidoglycan hydrolase-like protein with peptidoglycan-binding domain
MLQRLIAAALLVAAAAAAHAEEIGPLYAERLQILLLLHGYDPGSATGRVGPRTRAAAAQYRRDAELQPDRPLLEVLAQLEYGAPPVFAKRRPKGAPEPRVAAAQVMLKQLGYDPGAVDGREKTGTRQALAAFAADRRLGAASSLEILLPALRRAAQAQGIAPSRIGAPP